MNNVTMKQLINKIKKFNPLSIIETNVEFRLGEFRDQNTIFVDVFDGGIEQGHNVLKLTRLFHIYNCTDKQIKRSKGEHVKTYKNRLREYGFMLDVSVIVNHLVSINCDDESMTLIFSNNDETGRGYTKEIIFKR